MRSGPVMSLMSSTAPSGTISPGAVARLELADVLGGGAERRVGLRGHRYVRPRKLKSLT